LGRNKKFKYSNTLYKINHRIREWLRLEGTSGDHLVQPLLLSQGHPETLAQGSVQMAFEYLQ